MDRQNIVKLFLEKGFQLEPSLLEYLESNPKFINKLLDNLEAFKGQTTLTLDVLQDIEEKDVEIVKVYKRQPNRLSTNDVVTLLKNRYEKLSQILLRRLDLGKVISINRIKPSLKNFSIIGLVREKNEAQLSMIVEDTTGEREIFFQTNLENDYRFIFLDDVLAFSSELVDDRVIVKKVIYPDIPLKREIARTEEDLYCVFLSDVCMSNKKYLENFLKWFEEWRTKPLIIFIISCASNKEDLENFLNKIRYQNIYIVNNSNVSRGTYKLEDPCVVNIKGVTIFLTHGDMFKKYVEQTKTSIEETCLYLLKERHVNPTIDLQEVDLKDNFLLEEVPDIFVCGHSNKPSYLNYKGTTIVSCGDFINMPIFWSINLRTREIFKIDFT
jgi:DNA polymerase II small subunit/DNA polymerase delta subunit B